MHKCLFQIRKHWIARNSQMLSTKTDKEFAFEETTCAHIFSLLSKLCKSKATGLDNISAKLLRECPDLIAESLTYIFNQSLLTGIFPDE